MPKPDLLSLLIGLIIGILIVFLFSHPGFRKFLSKPASVSLKRTRQNNNVEDSLRKFLLRRVEGLHLSSFFCRLSDIYIPEKLISSPLFMDHLVDLDDIPVIFHNPISTAEIFDLTPNYPCPMLTLSEALSAGRNIVIKGRIGSGKTTTLANLAIEILERRCNNLQLNNYLPVYIHARDIDLSISQRDFEESIANGLACRELDINKSILFSILQRYRKDQRLLLLIDGLDEFCPEEFDRFVENLSVYLSSNPMVRIVTTSGPYYTGKLSTCGFSPLYTRAPELSDQLKLIKNFVNKLPADTYFPEKKVLLRWLKHDQVKSDLFQTTLVVLSYFFQINPSPQDPLEAYALYVSGNKLDTSGFIGIAESIARNKDLSINFSELENSIKRFTHGSDPEALHKGSVDTIKNSLLEHKVLVVGRSGSFYFLNPEYLCRLLSKSNNFQVSFDINLLSCSPIHNRIAQLDPENQYICNWLHQEEPNPHLKLFMALDHLLVKKDKIIDLSTDSEKIARLIISEGQPLTLRYIASLLICYAQPPVFNFLLNRLSQSNRPDFDALISLFVGMPGIQLPPELFERLYSYDFSCQPRINFILSLVNHLDIDEPGFIDAEIQAQTGKLAAELLALTGTNGHMRLLAYSNHENPNCRRNSVFGFRMINEPFAQNTLERLNKTDTAWMVRDAAAQALERRWDPRLYAPKVISAIDRNPEIIQFAAENGFARSQAGLTEELIEKLINSHTYGKQLLGIRYLYSMPGLQSRKVLSATVSRSNAVREIAFYALRELNYSR